MVINEDTCIPQKKMALFPYFYLMDKALYEKEGEIMCLDSWRINLNGLRILYCFFSLFVVLFCLFFYVFFFIIFSVQTF